MKKIPIHIFFGGSVYSDLQSIKAFAKSGGGLSWSALKRVKQGDRVLLYCDQPDSAFVATAEALTSAEPADDYPYRCRIGNIRLLARPIPRNEAQALLPDWPWVKATRGRATVDPKIQEQVWKTILRHSEREAPNTEPAASVEGRLRKTWSSTRERSRKNRDACLAALPPSQREAPPCAVCGMDFLARYGEIGRRFIHVHHCRPAASLDIAGEKLVSTEDLVAVCPNCHAMLHIGKSAAEGEVRSVEELQKLIRAAKRRA